MADIDYLSIVPVGRQQKIQDSLASRRNYQPYLPDSNGKLTIPNPETTYDFANRIINEWLYAEYEAYRVEADIKIARENTIGTVKNEF